MRSISIKYDDEVVKHASLNKKGLIVDEVVERASLNKKSSIDEKPPLIKGAFIVWENL